MEKLRAITYTLGAELKALGKTAIPTGKREMATLSILMISYLTIGACFLFQSSIIDYTSLKYNVYMGFDNLDFYQNGMNFNSHSRHPLLTILTSPILYIGDLLASTFGYKAKGVFSILLTSLAVSLSAIYLQRYMLSIVGLAKSTSNLLIAIYATSSTCLFLSFSTESFTISLFLLCFSILFYSSYLHKQKPISSFSIGLIAICLGGTTLSNFVKGLVPLLFIKKSFKKILIIGASISVIFLCLFALADLKYDILNKELVKSSIYFSGHGQSEVYGEAKAQHYIDYFFGAPVLMSEMVNTAKEEIYQAEFGFRFYENWEYVFILLLYIAVFYSFIVNRKNKLVQMLALMWATDLFIHIVCGFGIAESYIYGAHWVFIIPLSLAWLAKHLEAKVKLFNMALSLMLAVLTINNGYKLYQFLIQASQYYPPVNL